MVFVRYNVFFKKVHKEVVVCLNGRCVSEWENIPFVWVTTCTIFDLEVSLFAVV